MRLSLFGLRVCIVGAPLTSSLPHAVSDPFKIFESVFGSFGGGGGGGESEGAGGFPFGGGQGFPGGGQGFPGGGGGGRRGRQQPPAASLYANTPHIRELHKGDFKSVVGKASRGNATWILELYSPNCQHCVQLVPVLTKIADTLQGVVSVATVNCDADPAICTGCVLP